MFVEFLDGVYDHTSPDFRVILHALGEASGAGETLPKSCTLSEFLLECLHEGASGSPSVRIKRIRTRPGGDADKTKEVIGTTFISSQTLMNPVELLSDGCNIKTLNASEHRPPSGCNC